MDALSLMMFALALLVAAGTPGPSIAALVARVLARGWREVMPFVAAMWLGELAWLLMALAGLTTLAQSFHLAFSLLKWAGVAYLVWMAWGLWRAPDGTGGAELPRRGSGWSMFGAGLAVTLGNPKIMVFYLALLPSIIDLSSVTLFGLAELVLVALAVMAGVDLAWAFAAAWARRWFRSSRAVRIANRSSATAMGGAAVLIATR